MLNRYNMDHSHQALKTTNCTSLPTPIIGLYFRWSYRRQAASPFTLSQSEHALLCHLTHLWSVWKSRACTREKDWRRGYASCQTSETGLKIAHGRNCDICVSLKATVFWLSYHCHIWMEDRKRTIVLHYNLLSKNHFILLLSDFTEFFIYWRIALLLKDQSKKILRYRWLFLLK